MVLSIYISPVLLDLRTGECSIEINSVSASKGNALQPLCTRLDIPMSSVLAMGDNQNDIEMLRLAGVSVAMGSAQDDVKSAALHIAGTNEEDGAAAFPEEYFGLR
ncbi:MAG: HAD hydrolase family protein [Enterocloster asparagiformis]|nr:HAD hydrolase family protein [Enterocloster asparagiformis]